MKTFRIAAAVLVIALTTSAGRTEAADPGVLSGIIRNDTKITVNYYYRIDNGAWTSVSLLPGQSHVYSMPYSGVNQNRVTGICFDHTLNDQKAVIQNTTLVRYACKTPDQGWVQRFIITNDGKTLALAR